MDEIGFRWLNDLYLQAPQLFDLVASPWAALVVGVVAFWVVRSGPGFGWLLPAAFAVLVSDVVSVRVVKPLVGRERPCAVMEGAHLPVVDGARHCGSGEAMPSAHAANTAAVATVLASPGLGLVAAVAGVSRVISGQHWPTDVVAGWGLGWLVGTLVRIGCIRGLKWRFEPSS